MRSRRAEGGFSLIEVMVAMILLAFALLGAMAAAQWALRGAQAGEKGTRALALAESRLDAKRTRPWRALLEDDLDGDGLAEVMMRDDGIAPDRAAGDGVFTASAQVDGILLIWTVQPDRPGPVSRAGSVTISVSASYPAGQGRRQVVRMGTMRGNPRYLGER